MLKIRPVSYADVDSIIKIENSSFSAPFTREMFLGMVHVQPPFGGIIAEDDGKLVGYLFLSRVLDEMELLTIAVAEDSRKKGVGRALIERMIEEANSSHMKTIFLEVRPSNVPAKRLYENIGFEAFGIRKGYYKDNGEDAITMKKCLRT